MSNSAWSDLNRDGTFFWNDICPNSKWNCQKQITFTPKQYQLEGNGFKNKLKKMSKGAERAWNNFLKPAVINQ